MIYTRSEGIHGDDNGESGIAPGNGVTGRIRTNRRGSSTWTWMGMHIHGKVYIPGGQSTSVYIPAPREYRIPAPSLCIPFPPQ